VIEVKTIKANDLDNVDIRDCITVDFDDTILEHTGMYDPLPFSALSEKFPVVIVTSRIAGLDEIEEYCRKCGIRTEMIVYDAGLKVPVLKKISPLCHFDDNKNIVSLCIKNGIPAYLAGAGKEYRKVAVREVKKKGLYKWYLLSKIKLFFAKLRVDY
jgi:hypothetical protein